MTDTSGQPGPGAPGPGRDTADELQARMQAFGREAQASGERMAKDPGLIAFGTWVGRLWGLVLIAIGLWFLGLVTFHLDLPDLDWRLVWPIVLIGLGGLSILVAVTRRR